MGNSKDNQMQLYKVMKDYFKIGAAVNPMTIKSQESLIKKHFNSLTAENEMKFSHIQPSERNFTFDSADQVVTFAEQNKKVVRGHTLVWHNQTPDWVFHDKDGGLIDRDTLFNRMKNHIDTVINRYKDNIYAWDVVNEAVSDKDGEFIRPSKWLDIAGEKFIEKAFQFAHEADPKAKLFYNDYNESVPSKREKIVRLVKSLKEKDVPIHGIGLQAHWNLHSPSLEHIKRAIESYASLDVQLHITELDLSVFDHHDSRTDLKQPTEQMMQLQAERYYQIFQLFKEYKDYIDSVTFWGVADDYTWLDNFPVRGRRNWPFLFDTNHQPKQAFWRVMEKN